VRRARANRHLAVARARARAITIVSIITRTDDRRVADAAGDLPGEAAGRRHAADLAARVDAVAVDGAPEVLAVDQPLAHRAHLEGRAAHVGCDDVSQSHPLAECLRSDKAAHRPGLDHPYGARGRLVNRQEPAVRLCDEQLAAEAVVCQLPTEVVEVAVDDRAEARVQRDRGSALVLADNGRDLVRERQEEIGP